MSKNIALVLSSGGSRGLAQIGAIQVLEERGFVVRSVAGSSIGALVGGLHAMGRLNDYANWVSSLKKRDILGLMDFTLSTHGVLKGEKVFERMKSFIPDINIEDMPIPFAAVATDIIKRQEVVFTSGSFYKAIRASIAIPAVFTPVKYGSSILVDGGVINPVPIAHVKRTDNDLLVVINLNGRPRKNAVSISNQKHERHDRGLKKSLLQHLSVGEKFSSGYYSLLATASSIMLHRMAELTIEYYCPDILIEIPSDYAQTFDFYKAAELIEFGRLQAELVLNQKFNP